MLQAMRERVQGIIAIVICVLICITFVFFGIENYLKSHGDLDVIAKVNGVKITQKQVHANYERAKQQLMANMGKDYSYDQKMQDKIKSEIIQGLIKSEALLQGLTKLKFNASSMQIKGIIQQLPVFQKDGHFSDEIFQKVLANTMLSKEAFFNELKHSIMINQLRNGLIISNFILPNETNRAIKIFNQTRDIKYAVITINSLKNAIKITDQEIQDYYQQHQDEFKMSEQIGVSYLELFANDLKNEIRITPDEALQYYKNHIDNYSSPQRWQIERILVKISANAPQKEVDKAEKQIKALAEQAKSGIAFSKLDSIHGKAIWISESQIPHGANSMNVLKSMQVGEISGPFRTPSDFFVIKILQAEKAKIQPFDNVHEQVTKEVIQEKLSELFSEKTNKLADLAYTNSDSLLPAATELGLPIKATDLFTEQGKKIGLLGNSKFVKTAFSDAVLKQNYNSDLVELEPGHVVVMRIKEHKMAAVKPLSEVKPQIVQQLTNIAAQQKAKILGEKLVAAAKTDSSANSIKQQGLSWKLLKIKRQGTANLDPLLIKAAFSVPPSNGRLAIVGLILQNGDFAIIQVDKIYDGDSENFNKKQLKSFKHNMAAVFGEIDYNLYVEDLIKQAKIKEYDRK